MKDLELIAKKEFEVSKDEIISLVFEGKNYWLKKARETKPDKIQDFFYKFIPFELLIPPLRKSKEEALNFEVSKLEKLYNLGVNVPKIAIKNSEFFVLEDSGENLNGVLRNKELNEKDFYHYIHLALVELSKIHNLDSFHGGSQLRNFTLKDGKVFVIDFEESFKDGTDIKKLQYRDFLLFLLSFLKMKELSFKVNYERIIHKYLELSSNFEFKDKLVKFSKKLSPFLWLYEREFIKKRVGSDVRYFFELIKILKEMK
ncbi:MAG: hypothetical protein GX282_04420 [Campylobacteraceae bacterium]|nr:hypothetical protein [Campylobacteraceae bacterium]